VAQLKRASQLRVPRFMSKMRLRRQVGQMSHSRWREYPRPKEPPPMDRFVIAAPSRGQTGASPDDTCARMAFCSAGSNCA
jgi:hypothetical protein